MLVMGAAIALAACGGGLTGDSSCVDYVNASRDQQMAAAQKVAQEMSVSYSPVSQADVDSKCSVNPRGNLRLAVSGRSLPEGAKGAAKPLGTQANCQAFLDASPDVQMATANELQDQGYLEQLTETGIISLIRKACEGQDHPALKTIGGVLPYGAG